MPPQYRTIGIEIRAKDLTGAAFKKAASNVTKLGREVAKAGRLLAKPSTGWPALAGQALASLGVTASAAGVSFAALGAAAIPIAISAVGKLAKAATTLAGVFGRVLATAVQKTVQVFAKLVVGAVQLTFSLAKLAVQGLSVAIKGVLQLGAGLLKLAAITTGAVAVGIATITGLFIAAIVPATKYAAELDSVNRAFMAIEGEGAPAMLDALRKASAGMLTDLTLMKNFNDAVMLVNVAVGERMPEALQYLRKISAATGTDLQYMYESLVRGTGRLAPRIIDNLKVIVSLDEATARAAHMFGIEEEAVNKAQKQMGLFAVVMDRLKSRTEDLPDVIGTLAQKIASLGATAKNAQGIIGTLFMPVAHSLLNVGQAIGDAFTKLIATGGGLNRVFMHMSATTSVLLDVFGEMVTNALPAVEKGLDTMADRFISFAWRAIEWGANISSNLAIGIIRGAATSLIAAINWISNILSYWMAPGSAPRFLPDLYQWGVETFTEYLRGFEAADFSVLEAVQAPMKQALQVLLGLGEVSEEDVGARFVHATELMVQAMDEFNRTGSYGSSVLEELTAAGGQFGDQLARLFEAQIALSGGIKEVAAAELRLKRARDAEEASEENLISLAHEYNKAFRRGASREELARRYSAVRAGYQTLVTAREETEEAETQLDIAKEQLQILKDLAKVQEGLLKQLIAMQEARILPAEADEDADGDGIPGVDEEFPLPGMPDLTPLEDQFDDLKEKIRAKFAELWAGVVEDWEASGVGQLVTRMLETWEASELKEWWDLFWTDIISEDVGFWQAIENLWLKLVPTIQKYLDENQPELANIWRGFFQEGTDDGSGSVDFAAGLTAIWVEFLRATGIFLTEKIPILGGIWKAFTQAGVEDGSGKIDFKAGIIATWVAFASVLGTYLSEQVPSLGAIWKGFTQEGVEDGSGRIDFGTGLDTLWTVFWGSLQEKAYGWGQDFGLFLVDSLFGGLIDGILGYDTGIQELSILGWLLRLKMAIWMPISSFGMGLWDGIVEGFNLGIVTTGSSTTWNDFWDGLIEKAKDIFKAKSESQVFYDLGQDVVNGLISGLLSLQQELFDNAWNVARRPYDAVMESLGAGRDIGQRFIRAIGDGISSISLWDAAWNVARVAYDAIRDALLFGSPSALGIELGEGLVESVILGIERKATLPMEALSTATFTRGFNIPITAGVGGAGFGAGFAAPVGSTVIYQVTNNFGTDSVRSDADIYTLAEQIQRSLDLRSAGPGPL